MFRLPIIVIVIRLMMVIIAVIILILSIKKDDDNNNNNNDRSHSDSMCFAGIGEAFCRGAAPTYAPIAGVLVQCTYGNFP